MTNAFAYLSVLVSIIVGLGMAHILSAAVRLVHNRKRVKFYWPTLVWAVNIFGLLTLLWWADFSLNGHEHWTFASFLCTLALPAVLYVAAGVMLPAADVRADDDLRAAYDDNRVWFLALISGAIVLSFVQTYLLDGIVYADLDSVLKAAVALLPLIAIVFRGDVVQKAVAALNLAWLTVYVGLLFVNLRS